MKQREKLWILFSFLSRKENDAKYLWCIPNTKQQLIISAVSIMASLSTFPILSLYYSFSFEKLPIKLCVSYIYKNKHCHIILVEDVDSRSFTKDPSPTDSLFSVSITPFHVKGQDAVMAEVHHHQQQS